MAISTYSELQAAAANWLVRGDLTARVPEFITLAEARLNRIARARRAETEASLTLASAARTIALPAAFGEPLRCWIVVDSERDELPYMEPSLLSASSLQARPAVWTIDAANLAFDRAADQAYGIVLRYLARFTLSDAAPTNALLSDAPDLYLFGTLCEAAPFLRDADLASAYETKFSRAVREFNSKESRSKSKTALGTEIGEMLNSRPTFDITRGY